MMLLVKVGIGVLTAGLGVAMAETGGAVVPTQQTPFPQQGVVSILSDANAFDIRSDGRLQRVRLANIVAPTPAGPGMQAQCLGPEASAFLAAVIPVGTALHLTYSQDRFGRALAQARTDDGRLVNAELARGGLVEVVGGVGDEATVPPAIEAAARDAATNKRGFYSADVGCTVPGQVKTLLDVVARVPAGPAPGARGADLHNAANAATDARVAADELLWAFGQNRQDIPWRVLDSATRADLQKQVAAARDRVAAAEVSLRNAASLTFNSEVTQFAVNAENARVAKQQAAIRAAQARRAAEAARRAEAARQAQAAARAAARRNDDDSRGRDSRSDDSRRGDSRRGDSEN